MNQKFEDIRKDGDFKPYFCTTSNLHVWVLGYFGGGALNVQRTHDAAQTFAKHTGVKIESVQIDEIFRSRRFKHFKYLTSTEANQQTMPFCIESEKVFEWLKD